MARKHTTPASREAELLARIADLEVRMPSFERPSPSCGLTSRTPPDGSTLSGN
jgi:hypothetical protein